MKKYKFKKSIIYIVLFIVFFIILGATSLIIHDNNLKEINNNYSELVITKRDSYIYNKNKKKIGTLSKDYVLKLEKINTNTIKDKYFKIKDDDYYVSYKDIIGYEKEFISNIKDYYLPTNKSINLSNTRLYYSDKISFKVLNDTSFDILYEDNNKYYIKLFGNVFYINKNKNIKEIANNNDFNDVNVLYYERVEKSCTDNNCTPILNFKEQVLELINNGYYSITMDEYKLHKNKYLNLKDKAILIVTNSDNDSINSLKKDLNISIEKYDNVIDKFHSIMAYSSISDINKMAKGEDITSTPPIGEVKVPVLNYHFFYDPTIRESCNEVICITTQKFREHLDYLRDNGYRTLTMKEFKDWMYGEYNIPEKSVLITIDDGAMGTGKHNGNKLIPILEEYKMNATLFLITGWWDIANYISPYLTIQSHTDDMHQYGSCGRGQINCATYENAKKDLQQSLNIIGNNDSFCYPFYYYSDQTIQVLKDLDFKLAFAGGNRKATRSSNKYIIPRYPIQSNITLEQFKNIVN